MGWIIAAAVVVALVAAPLFAADSRDDGGWKPPTVGALGRLMQPVRPFSQSPGVLVVRHSVARAHKSLFGQRVRPAHSPRPVAKGSAPAHG